MTNDPEARTFEVTGTELVNGRHVPRTLVLAENPKTQQIHLIGSMTEPHQPDYGRPGDSKHPVVVAPYYSPSHFPGLDPARMPNIGNTVKFLYPDLQKHLRALVDYAWDEERINFFEEPCQGHIFESLVVLDNLLEGTNHTPESYINDILK